MYLSIFSPLLILPLVAGKLVQKEHELLSSTKGSDSPLLLYTGTVPAFADDADDALYDREAIARDENAERAKDQLLAMKDAHEKPKPDFADHETDTVFKKKSALYDFAKQIQDATNEKLSSGPSSGENIKAPSNIELIESKGKIPSLVAKVSDAFEDRNNADDTSTSANNKEETSDFYSSKNYRRVDEDGHVLDGQNGVNLVVEQDTRKIERTSGRR